MIVNTFGTVSSTDVVSSVSIDEANAASRKAPGIKISDQKKFIQSMKTAAKHKDPEKAVESAVNVLMNTYFNVRYGKDFTIETTYPFATDGVLTAKRKRHDLFSGVSDTDSSVPNEFSILVETKRAFEFSGDNGLSYRSKAIAQVIYYLKKFKDAGHVIPNAFVIADEDEMFAMSSKLVMSYLDKDYDWSIAPSSAWSENVELFSALLEDKNLRLVHVEHPLESSFDVNFFLDKLNSFAIDCDALSRLKINSVTLTRAFDEFNHSVFGGETVKDDTKVKASIFIQSLLAEDTIYPSPGKKNELTVISKDHKGREHVTRYPFRAGQYFSANAYELFFTKWDKNVYTLDEQKEITEIGDTLFEEFDRRMTGDFWTPKIWVDEAHKVLEEQLGTDWKEKYVVWDAACGSKNLTRDYKFNELYCSTLHQEELNISAGYNPEATAFQYDFLNDDIDLHLLDDGLGLEIDNREWKLPAGLINALKQNKPIVFFMNPPYGQATSGMGKEHKTGIGTTAVSGFMKKDGITGLATKELYTQFIYRVEMLAKTFSYTQDFFFFFFNKGFLTTQSFSNFTEDLYSKFEFKDGFMLNAGEFNGTSSAWGIIFSGWELSSAGTKIAPKMNVLKSDISDAELHISQLATWEAKFTPEIPLDFFSRIKIDKKLSVFPTTSNGFNNSDGKSPRSNYSLSSFGYLQALGSNIQKTVRETLMFSMANYQANGTPVEPQNFVNSCVVFSVRKSWLDIIAEQKLLWVRDKDVFPAPTQEFQQSQNWDEFANDSVVYSLFASGSNQTSLRNYEYETEPDGSTKKWRVENQFFWLSMQQVKNLAIENQVVEIEQDMVGDSERYVHNFLQGKELSTEAQTLLNIATKIHAASFKYRKPFNYEQPKYNLLTWDSGWEQIRRMCYSNDAFLPAKQDPILINLYNEFKQARKALGDKIAHKYSEDTDF